MRKRHLSIAAAGVVLAVAVAGCGSDDDDSGSESSSGKAAKVAWLTYDYLDYQQAEKKGLDAALKENGGSVKVFNAKYDPQKMQQQCTDVATSGRYNVILIAPVDPTSAVACAGAAKAANMPVVSLESPVGKNINDINPQTDGVVGSVVLSAAEGATTQAALLKDACAGKDPCNVIVDATNDSLGQPLLKALKAVEGVKVVQHINSNYDPSQVQKIVPDALSAHPNTDVLTVMSDEVGLAAVPAIKDAGLSDKVKIIGLGASRRSTQAIKDGTIFGSAGIWPEQWGNIAGTMAIKAVNGETIDPAGVSAFKVDEPRLVTKKTVNEFTPEWGPAPSS